MPTFRSVLAAVGLAAASVPLAFAAPPTEVAYVSNQAGGVTVINLHNMKAEKTFSVGGKGPRGIGITPNGKYLLTANEHTADVSVIDTSTDKVVKRIHIGKNPEFLRIEPNGKYAVVTYEPSSTGGPPTKASEKKAKEEDKPAQLAVIDLVNGRVKDHVSGGLETEGIEFSPKDHYLVMANEGNNTLGVYDLDSWHLVKTVDLQKYGYRPRGVKLAPDGNSYIVTMENSGNFLVLNRKFQVEKSVKTAAGPYGVAFDKEGNRIFIGAARAHKLEVFNAHTYKKIASIPVGKRCWHFSFTPGEKHILLACGRSNAVYDINASDYKTIKVMKGFKLPCGIVTYPKTYGSLDAPAPE